MKAYKKKFILVGPKVAEIDSRGGVGTLSNALIDYAKKYEYIVEIIDTKKKPFEKSNLLKDIRSVIFRITRLISLFCYSKHSGLIIFSSAGLGFYEKIVLSLISRIAKVPSLFIIVDGWFFSVRNRTFIARCWIGFLLKIPSFLAASGFNWRVLFIELGVKESNIISVKYWLPKSFKIIQKPKIILEKQQIKFIFIGWMIKEKGLNEILSSIKSLYYKHSFNFTFVGDGPMLETVRKTIKKHKWETRVFVRGWISNELKEKELAAAHIFVLPSYAEGFPMSLIEAMSSGLPAICSDVGGISDSLRDGKNGFLIPAQDTQSLENAMLFYIKNPHIISKHSSQALNTAIINHNSDKNCKELFELFTAGKQ